MHLATFHAVFAVLPLLAMAPAHSYGLQENWHLRWVSQFGTADSDDRVEGLSGFGGRWHAAGMIGNEGFVTQGLCGWQRRFGRGLVGFYCRDVATDRWGNVVVVGRVGESMHGQSHVGAGDAFVIKYDRCGNRCWTRLLGSDAFDEAKAVCVDCSGNVVLTGTTDGNLGGQTSNGERDLFVAKYDACGNLLWVRLKGWEQDDFGNDVAVDACGNIAVVGYARTSGPLRKPLIAKFNSMGTELWSTVIDQNEAIGRCCAFDSRGNLLIAFDKSPDGTQRNIFVWQLDTMGNYTAGTSLGTPGNDSVLSLAVGPGSRVAIGGTTSGAFAGYTNQGERDAYVATIDFCCNRHSVYQFGTSANDTAGAVYFAGHNQIVVGGATAGQLGAQHFGGLDVFLMSVSYAR